MANGADLEKHYANIRRIALVTQYLDALTSAEGEVKVRKLWQEGINSKDSQSLVAHNEASMAARVILSAHRRPQEALDAWAKKVHPELTLAVSKILESAPSHEAAKNTWFELHEKIPIRTSVSSIYRGILHDREPKQKPLAKPFEKPRPHGK